MPTEFQSRWSFWSRDQHRHQQHPQQQYAPPTSSPNPQPYERMTSTSDSWLRCSDPGAPPPPGGPSSATNQRHQYNKKARPQHSSNGMNTNTVNGNSSRSSSSGGWMASLKRAAKALKREVLAVYYAMQVSTRERSRTSLVCHACCAGVGFGHAHKLHQHNVPSDDDKASLLA